MKCWFKYKCPCVRLQGSVVSCKNQDQIRKAVSDSIKIWTTRFRHNLRVGDGYKKKKKKRIADLGRGDAAAFNRAWGILVYSSSKIAALFTCVPDAQDQDFLPIDPVMKYVTASSERNYQLPKRRKVFEWVA